MTRTIAKTIRVTAEQWKRVENVAADPLDGAIDATGLIKEYERPLLSQESCLRCM